MIVNGISLLVIITGLVEFSKKLGIKGKALIWLSMLIGLVLGITGEMAETGTPVDMLGWFTVAIVGLAYGLAACGLYDMMDERLPKGYTIPIAITSDGENDKKDDQPMEE